MRVNIFFEFSRTRLCVYMCIEFFVSMMRAHLSVQKARLRLCRALLGVGKDFLENNSGLFVCM